MTVVGADTGLDVGTALAPQEAAALTAVAKGVALIRRAADRSLAADGRLTRVQFEILRELAGAPEGLRMFDLADRLVVSRSGLTYQVTQMANAGLVEREGGTSEHRAVLARITGTGRDLLQERRSEHAKMIRRHLIDTLAPGELEILTSIFTRVAESFERDCHDAG